MGIETEREGRCIDCLYSDSGWCKDSCACDCHPASDETGLERAEQNFRALVRCRSNGGGLEDFLAEYDRRGEEIGRLQEQLRLANFDYAGGYQRGYADGVSKSEALGLLRELVAHWDDENVSLPSAGDDWAEVGTRLGLTARDLKRRIRALVER